ncbi:hypothetical protein [Nocardiopsis alborubida]|nr:hypothetical protein [Nocardiopsis alborubida]
MQPSTSRWTKKARKAGVSQSTLDVLSAWREVASFTDGQRAALELASP